tara:strand:- start:933 stop:2081 length:1149 start_codon:yes stop_codon:yes gene_type:complete
LEAFTNVSSFRITAHNRASLSAVGGYIFDQCLFTAATNATADLNQQVYLGRPYNAYARVVVKYSYLDSIIQPAGWKVWSATDPRTDYITFAEYQNTGPGNWESNAVARASFGNATLLTSDTYSLSSVMASTSWIDMTYWDSIVTPQPTIAPVETSNSTIPPSGACIVSKTAITGQVTYTTIAQCIALLPTTSAIQTIFIYPGTYNEQLTFNRSAATIFKGYSEDPTNYATNQVIITNSAGVDTQGDASNSDSATFYSRGKNVKFYNINLVNTFGKAADYASLGFSVGNNGNASFYGCQILGNQDTFNVNVGKWSQSSVKSKANVRNRCQHFCVQHVHRRFNRFHLGLRFHVFLGLDHCSKHQRNLNHGRQASHQYVNWRNRF